MPAFLPSAHFAQRRMAGRQWPAAKRRQAQPHLYTQQFSIRFTLGRKQTIFHVMKKLLPKLIIAIVVLVIIAGVALFLSLNAIVKKGVETVGPQVTKTTVTLESARISPLSGAGGIHGLVVGNPEGYQTPSAIRLGEASLAIDAMSVFSGKVRVKSVRVADAEITFEGSLKGSNLTKLLENVQSVAGGGESTGASKKLQVDEVTITGAKVRLSATVFGGQSATVPLPDIRLTDLGTGEEGITPAELVQKVLAAVTKETTKAVAEPLAKLGKNAGEAVGKAGEEAAEGVKKIGEGLKGIFKK